MGTRALIAVANPDGSFDSIYTHWDGNPSHHGPLLLGHYATPQRVRELIALGDLSSLAPRPAPAEGEPHSFADPADDVCVAYGRDRGEQDAAAQRSASPHELRALTQQCGGEWLYLFELDATWHVAEGGVGLFGMPSTRQPGDLQPLREYVEGIAS